MRGARLEVIGHFYKIVYCEEAIIICVVWSGGRAPQATGNTERSTRGARLDVIGHFYKIVDCEEAIIICVVWGGGRAPEICGPND